MVVHLAPRRLASASRSTSRPSHDPRLWRMLAALLLAVTAACDPCFGTSACTDPHVGVQGRVISNLTGEPAAGTRVELRPIGGVWATQDTLTAIADERGVFAFRAPAAQQGTAVGRLVFYPPEPYGGFVYDVGEIQIATTGVRGDVRELGLWSVGPLRVPPHISYVGEVFYLDTGERPTGVEVEFRRTGGVAVEPDTVVVTTDQYGRFPLFMQAASEGTLFGDLYIRPPAPYQPLVVRGVEMETTIAKDYIRLIGVWGVER